MWASAYCICHMLVQVCFFTRVDRQIYSYILYILTLLHILFIHLFFLHRIICISFSTQVIMQFPSLPESRVQSPSNSLCLYRHSHQSHQHTHTYLEYNIHITVRSQCKYINIYIYIYKYFLKKTCV